MAYGKTAAKKSGDKMAKEEVQKLVAQMIRTAVSYTDSKLSPARATATKYYKGEKFGNEEEGRSQVVMTEVRDGVLGILPTLLETFFGPERPVEFVPKREDTVDMAEQATDYVHNVYAEENAGFLETYAVLKDGLVRRLGVFKWYWCDPVEKAYRLEGLSQEEVDALAGDPEIEIVSVEPRGEESEEVVFDVDLTRIERDGHPIIKAVPPEEFIVDPEATSLEDALFVAHRTEKTRSQLLELGYSEKDIDDAASMETELDGNVERIERRDEHADAHQIDGGKANRKYLYVESYPYLDLDGNDKAELVKVCTIGKSSHVVHTEPADERPFALFIPDPEPHSLEGQSWADRLMDIQEVTSALTRAGLDGLSSSLFPQTAYQEGMVNPLDLMNKEIGSRIRTRARPSDVLQEFRTSFDMGGVSGMLDYFDKVKTARTGQTNGAAALDTEALQSSTQTAVAAQVSAMKAQGRMLARIFAEMTFKPLFRGILRLLVKHQPKAKMMRLRGKWVQVDPRVWDANMDVSVNVAMGSGSSEQKLAVLTGILAEQKEQIAQFGPSGPIVTLMEVRATLAAMAELAGRKDSKKHFRPFGEQEFAAWMEQQANQEPPPSPEMILAQAQIEVERMKAEKDIELAEAKEMREHRKLELEDDRERDKLAAEIALREKELELKYSAELSKAQIQADIARERQTSAGSEDAGE
jgi:hypothetical protein